MLEEIMTFINRRLANPDLDAKDRKMYEDFGERIILMILEEYSSG